MNFINSPAYFGILDLSGEDVNVKNLFTNNEWDEMIQDFQQNVQLSDLKEEHERPLYELMDRITEVTMQSTLFFLHPNLPAKTAISYYC